MSATTNMRTLTVAALLTAACALQAHARTESIAVSGTQAPGLPAGVLFGNSLGIPIIDESGTVAHTSPLTGTGITSDNDQAIWRNTTLEVQKGDPAPDTPLGVNFADLGDPIIDRFNRITHRSSLTGTGVDASNDQGIWLDEFKNAREGDPAHDLPAGVVFATNAFPTDPAVNVEFSNAFYTAIVSGTGINSSNNQGIWMGTKLEIREGEPAPGTPTGVVFGSLGTPRTGDFSQIAHNSFLDGTGVTFANDEGIWHNDTLVAREGNPAPGTPAGVVFGTLGDPSMNASQAVHVSYLTGSGITADNDRGIWVGNALIAREGSQAPGLPDGVNFDGLRTPVINAAGQVAHNSRLQTGGLVSFANNEGIWRNDTLIAREGSPAGGVPGAVFSGFLGDPVINNLGIVAHNSLVDGAGINNEGIWLADGIEQILAVREGDILSGKTVQSITIKEPATTSDGRGSPLNEQGQLAFKVRFDDDTDGIFLYTPTLHWRNPTPTGDWDDANNWTLGILPSFLHDITIDPDHDVHIDGPDIGSLFRPDLVTIGGGGGIATVSVRDIIFDPRDPLTVNYNGHLIIRDTATVPTDNIDMGVATATPLDQPATLTVIGPTADITISDTTNIGVNAPAILNATNNTYAFVTDLNVGISSHGTLNVLTGADAEADNSATFGQNPGSTGTLNVDGDGSTILVAAEIDAGVGGNAHINVTNGGTVNADDGINLATTATSVSTINVQGPTATLNAGGLNLADAGHATATVQNGATLDLTGSTRLGIGATGNATLTITGPGTFLDARGVEAGINGNGSILLANGANAISNDVVLGQSPTAEGSLTLSGPATTWNAGVTLIGTMGGTGNLRVEDGAKFNATFLTTFIGNGTGSVGDATVTGTGSTFSATGPLTLGASGGTGTLHLTDAGLASFGGLTTINAGSTIHIDGGNLTTLGLAGTGDLQLISGTLNLTDNTTIDTNLFDPNLTLGIGTAINVINDATLAPAIDAVIDGGNLSADMLTVDGSLAVDSGLVSAGTAVLNNGVVQLGNSVTARINTPTFDNLGDLSGTGRITGNLLNSGTINASAGTLRIDGNATNNASGIVSLTGGQLRVTGTFTNAANALVIGNGTLRADAGLTNQDFATMAFSGTANILGDVDNQQKALIVSTGPGPLTFFDDVINDGEIRTNTGGFTVFLGTTSGSGSYTGTGTVIMEADFTPGSSPGINTFGGNLSFGPVATLEIEIGGLLAGSDYDQVVVANAVSLDGTLNVLLTDGFMPAPGDSFEIITAASILDTFDVESLPALPGSLEWFVNYSSTSVELVSTFAGDFDIDGDVDGFDFLKWQRGESPDPLSQSDLANWQANYGMVASPITTALATVPEPATGIMLLIGMATILTGGRTLVSKLNCA